MDNQNKQKVILEELNILVSPLVKASQDTDSLFRFLRVLGWDFEHQDIVPISDLQNAISDLSVSIQNITDLINNPPNSLLDLANALETTQSIFATLNSLDDFVNGATSSYVPTSLKNELSSLGKDVLDLLTTNYLSQRSSKLYLVLLTLGIVEDHRFTALDDILVHPDGWERNSRYYARINYQKVGDLFSNPVQYLKNEFYPASGNLNTESEAKDFSNKLFPRLQLLFEELGFETDYGVDPEHESLMPANDFAKLSRTLTISYSTDVDTEFGASFLFSPGGDGGFGLVITPFGEWNFVKKIKDWLLLGNVSGSLSGFAINTTGVTFPSSFNDLSLDIDLTMIKLFNNLSPTNQIGSTSGTRIEVGKLAAQVFAKLDLGQVNYGGKVAAERIALYVGGGEGDGFLNKIFPEPLKMDFDLIAGWSNNHGFYFEGGGSLNVVIPVHKKLLGIELKAVYISMKFENGELIAEISADTGLEIGPFVASVNRLGLESLIKFERGNLGPIDASLDFKPPNGVGFAIDASAIKGGGFLSFDFEEERYVGALELSIKDKVSLKVIGILTTKLPGNDDGYSLLLLITAEFEPLNLGFGFTLNGVGGIIALNRTMNLEYLRNGVKANTLDNILFPTDPIDNISQIISDLEGAFPVQEGRYAFGPMAIIGWGTPTLITVELGLMIEVPSPVRIAVLGVLKAVLPTEEKSLLKLQVNFLGTIDFEAKFITFDASIFDSKLLTFTLEGDMAFRLKWGDNPNFLFSIGGFHPSYTPPPLELPSMDRITINLLGGDNPRLTLTSYFALTSNTVQFGSKVDFYYRITNNYTVIGYLGFDILIQFNPFYLIASIAAQLAVMKDSEAVFSIYLGASISGPAPWHAQGTAEFKICGITLKVNFDKTFGQPETTTLPNVDILPRLIEAIENKANWQAVNAQNSNLLVTLRELNNDSGDVVAHPFGSIGVSQKIVPLNMTINKFGTQRPADFQNFSLEITDDAANPTSFETDDVKDFFAPAEYLELSDSSKLTRKSFEEFKSGVAIKGSDALKSSYLMERELEYEQVIMDSRRFPEKIGKIKETSLRFNSFRKNGTAAKSNLGTKSKPRSENAPPKVSVRQEKFAIANVDDLTQYDGMEAGSEAEARVLLEDLIRSNPSLTDSIQVVPSYEIA